MRWNHFYKYFEGVKGPSNLLYEPFVSEDNTVFLMHFNNNNNYFKNINYSNDLVEWWFQREVEFLTVLSHKFYIPEVLDIDFEDKKIYYRWYNKNLNVLFEESDIENYQPLWKEQIQNIKKDLENEGILKLNIYPHTTFLDSNDIIRISDMYGCVYVEDAIWPLSKLDPVIRPNGGDNYRFEQAIDGDTINLSKYYRYVIDNNCGKWPENALNE